jgi:GMP synthase-like glutamine amidotransferase
MRIHYFQHVPFEGLGNIEDWIVSKGHPLSSTRFFRNETPPPLGDIDWLIIMGGPMGVYDEDKYPWLAAEKQFIRGAIDRGITVLGICLGAQLIASALGAKVHPHVCKEIGWFPITLTPEGVASAVFEGFPRELEVFHWHGDTFALPAGAKHLAASAACSNQAFLYKRNVLALQFHLDVRRSTIAEWVKEGAGELVPAPYIQEADQMLAPKKSFPIIEEYMWQLLDRLADEKN